MSAYTTQSAIEGEIAPSDLIAFTDDGNTGSLNETILNQIIANASGYIDARVANIYEVPFDPVPSAVASMALSIVCYRLFRRRLTPDEKNPFYEEWKEVRAFLDEVNKGEAHIDLTQQRDFPQGALTSQPSIYTGGSPFTAGLATTM